MNNTTTTYPEDKELKIKVTHNGIEFKTWKELKEYYDTQFKNRSLQ